MDDADSTAAAVVTGVLHHDWNDPCKTVQPCDLLAKSSNLGSLQDTHHVLVLAVPKDFTLLCLCQGKRIRIDPASEMSKRLIGPPALPVVRQMGEGETVIFFQELAGSLPLERLASRLPSLQSR